MGAHVVECLRCGSQRLVQRAAHDRGDCPRCGYVGWAPASDLSEHARRALRERPLEARRLRVTAA
jgi:ribosomal protein S27AE